MTSGTRVYADPTIELSGGLQGYVTSSYANIIAVFGVICQREGTTRLPGAWDHLGALLRMLGRWVGVKSAAVSLAVGGAFDDEGVGVGGESVDC
jgi:hypothetical protein